MQVKVHPPFLLGFLPKVSSASPRLPPPPPNTTPGRNGTSGTSYSSLNAPCNPRDPDRTQHLPDPPSPGRERKGGIDFFGDRRGLAPPRPPPGFRPRSADELDKRGRSCGGAADADWASTASAPRLLPRLPAPSRSRPRPAGETQARSVLCVKPPKRERTASSKNTHVTL
ncbi:vesicle-associated membrane protein 4 isoform X1 [Myotis daubentonii]|uniref:vesicle-associated membrane protein 4 isoform X1 n=1 Tax=Myotis daubentonii TaxID=98922 RepID=UPI0028737246|nr:vesicle-associated membrane protein 4 isoform X1 [Myotis daubentonii]